MIIGTVFKIMDGPPTISIFVEGACIYLWHYFLALADQGNG